MLNIAFNLNLNLEKKGQGIQMKWFLVHFPELFEVKESIMGLGFAKPIITRKRS